jgi:membrane protein DedA with SNARE-associated domain
VPISRFLMYDLLGAVISVPLMVSLGYLFGTQIEQILHYIGGIQRALLIIAGLSVLIWLTRLLVTSRPNGQSKGPQPEVD